MKYTLLLLLCWLPCVAQPVPSDHYTYSVSTTASTVQQPATQARQITFGDSDNAGLSVYCASASTITFSWNATTPASATAGAEKKLPGTQQPSGVTVWSGSNASGGVSGPVYNVAAGGTMLFSLTWFKLGTQGTFANITITTSNACTHTWLYSAI